MKPAYEFLIALHRLAASGETPPFTNDVADAASHQGEGSPVFDIPSTSCTTDFTSVEDQTEFGEWFRKLEAMKGLKSGWNGYDAEPPDERALANSRAFLQSLLFEQFPPTRVAPSVVGGVGITRKVGERRVYVEFYNSGIVHALLAEGEKAETMPVEASPEGFRAFVARAREYLDG